MPKYFFTTEEIVLHTHELEINLPVDMGLSTERLTDRLAREVAKNRALDGIAKQEKVISVRRGEGLNAVIIWPRKSRAKTTGSKTFSNSSSKTPVLNDVRDE